MKSDHTNSSIMLVHKWGAYLQANQQVGHPEQAPRYRLDKFVSLPQEPKQDKKVEHRPGEHDSCSMPEFICQTARCSSSAKEDQC